MAWPYANGPRHLGHGASLLPGDVLARFHRSVGDDVLMVSGTDEYGTPNVIAAEAAEQDTKHYVDETNELIRNDFIKLGMSFDWFTRTTSPEHTDNAQNFFKKLTDAGYIEEGTMLGAFDEATDQALPDRYVEGTCPNCGASSRGDQCESCNSLLDPVDLIDPVSKVTGNPVTFRDTDHYFLKLDTLAPDVIAWLEANEELRPNAKSASVEMASALQPRAITRDMTWGVPLPEGYETEEDRDKVLYVWFEAVTGYLSASIEWAKNGEDPEAWREWWEDNGARHYYAMGKDNVPFHTIVWPAMIAAANRSGFTADEKVLHQPDVIASTEYLTFNDGKLSSSRGNVVYVSDMLELVGPDALRYYLIAAGPENKDANFSFHELARRANDELVAKWGNLVGRSVSLIHKNHGGRIPEVDPELLSTESTELLQTVEGAYDEIGELIRQAKLSAALRKTMETASLVNKFIHNAEPWKSIKTDPDQAAQDMYTVMTAVQNINVLMSPFLPHASQRVHTLLGGTGEIASQPISQVVKTEPPFSVLTGNYENNRRTWHFRNAIPGASTGQIEGKHLFKKLDEKELESAFSEIALRRRLGKIASN